MNSEKLVECSLSKFIVLEVVIILIKVLKSNKTQDLVRLYLKNPDIFVKQLEY